MKVIKTIKSASNDVIYARKKWNEFVSTLSLADDDKKYLAKLTDVYNDAVQKKEEVMFKEELAQIFKSVNRLVE